MSPLIERDCFGIVVGQNDKNGYVNITKLSAAYKNQTGKYRKPAHWLQNKRTVESIEHLSSVVGIPSSQLVKTRKGNSNSIEQGTWIHPKLAVRFAIWLSDEFGYMVEQWFEEWVVEKAKPKINGQTIDPNMTPQQAIAFLTDSMQKANVDNALIASQEVEMFAQFYPQYRTAADQTKAQIAASTTLPELPKTPTEIGSLFAQKMGYTKAVLAKDINQMLIDRGLQEKVERVSKKSGRTKYEYVPTELGKKYGILVSTTAKNSTGTVFVLRWYASVVDFLLANAEKLKIQ